MEGASLDAEAMDNERSTVEDDVKGKLYGGNGDLGDESLDGG